jgi:choice-of-anchor B domain-containing protein
MTQLSRVNYQTLHGVQCNDVWGYVDETGKEYALVGTTDGTGVVDVTDPLNPVEIFWAPGMNSIWRDIKVWGDFAYVTTEAQEGLMIIDLSPLPGSAALTYTHYSGPAGNEWYSAHNIWIDEQGYGYINGANRGNGGIIILDLFTNPGVPDEVGAFDDWYSHDCWVKNDTLYGAHIEDGFFSIVDITNRTSPVLLATQNTPGTFCHNVWGNDQMTTLFTTDEIGGGYLASYNVSDPSNITELDRVQSNPGLYVIPHNAHFLNDYIITSYYRDGVTIHDVSDPANMVLVGNFDTSPFSGNGFNGCWGAYPYLPSGVVLATDIERGLFVLGATYTRGAYLNGTVTDNNTGFAIGNAEVRLLGQGITELTKINGLYKTGVSIAGTYQVRYSKPGYFADTLDVVLTNGIIVVQNVALVPMNAFTLTGNVKEQGTASAIQGAVVVLESNDFMYQAVTDASGNFSISGFYQGDYFVAAGHWGHRVDCRDTVYIDASAGAINFTLPVGYYDDFSVNLNWTDVFAAAGGKWERADPAGSTSTSAPAYDALYDCGAKAYVTGNVGGHPDNDDVDDGYVLLQSPVMNLTGYTDPHVNYAKWFYCKFGPNPEDDSLKIYLNDGTNSFLIDYVSFAQESRFSQWLDTSIRVLDHISNLTTVRLEVYTSDFNPDVNITEAGIDYFHVTNEWVYSTQETEWNEGLQIYPNPGGDYLNLLTDKEGIINIYDITGKIVSTTINKYGVQQVNTSSLSKGAYLLQFIQEDGTVRVMKWTKGS